MKLERQKTEFESKINEINKLNKELEQANKKLSDIINECKKKEEDLTKKYDEISNNEKKLKDNIISLEKEKQNLEKENQELQKVKKQIDNDLEDKDNNNNNSIIRNPIYNIIFNESFKLNDTRDEYNISDNMIVSKENIKKEEEMYRYKKESNPKLIGLNNIGSTSLINSVLQCLLQTNDLTKYFINNKNIIYKLNNKSEPQLSLAFLELIENLWNINGPNSYIPNNFINILQKINSKLYIQQTGFSEDLILFIIEQIHNELQQLIKNNNINYIDINSLVNHYDKDNALKHFYYEFQQNYSIISDLFFGIEETTNICLNCKNYYNSKGLNNPIYYNYIKMNCLIFPLDEINNYNYNTINQNNLSIYDCLYYYQRNIFNGNMKNHCNFCNQLCDSISNTRIFKSPNILIIILIRNQQNLYNIKYNITETIDITQFVLQKEFPIMTYNLYGVITQVIQGNENNHFIASCKSSVDFKWYRYNDDKVTLITNLQSEVFDFGIPLILFYKKN